MTKSLLSEMILESRQYFDEVVIKNLVTYFLDNLYNPNSGIDSLFASCMEKTCQLSRLAWQIMIS